MRLQQMIRGCRDDDYIPYESAFASYSLQITSNKGTRSISASNIHSLIIHFICLLKKTIGKRSSNTTIVAN